MPKYVVRGKKGREREIGKERDRKIVKRERDINTISYKKASYLIVAQQVNPGLAILYLPATTPSPLLSLF